MSDNTNYVMSHELSETRTVTGFASVSVGKLSAKSFLARSDISVLILILTVEFFYVTIPPFSSNEFIIWLLTLSETLSLFTISIALSIK